MFGNIYKLGTMVKPTAELRTSVQLLLSRLQHGAPKIRTSLGHLHKHAAIKQSVRQLSENCNMHNLCPQTFEYLILFPAFSVRRCQKFNESLEISRMNI